MMNFSGIKSIFICSLVFLSGCNSIENSPIKVAAFCDAAKAIYWSKKDTDPTKIQIKQHNNVGKKLCGWTGRVPPKPDRR